MSNFFNFLILATGLYFSIFLFWKFLRDDYEDSDIFMLWAISLVGGILGFSVVNFFATSDALFGGLVVAVLFGMLRARKLKMELFEVLEACVPSVFLFLLFVLLSWGVSGITGGIIVEFVLIILVLVLFSFLRSRYRRFLWYPSGRVGFASLLSVSLYFIARAVVALLTSNMLFFDLVLFSLPTTLTFGLFVGVGSLVLLYVRSGRGDVARFLRKQ